MTSQGFFHALPPEGSLTKSQPITLSQPLKKATTLTHILVNLSAIPFLLVKKSCENLITSSVAQYLKNQIFIQSYFKGIPSLSQCSQTLRGAGKDIFVTNQSGKPYPQNLRLYRSWWASRRMLMPYFFDYRVIFLSFYKYVQLNCPSFGQKPYHATYSLKALKPHQFKFRKSQEDKDVIGSNESVLGQYGNYLYTTLTPWKNTYRPLSSVKQVVIGSA